MRWQASLLGRLRQGSRGGWSLGASGAVYACFAVSAVLFPDRTAHLIFLPNVRPAHALWNMLTNLCLYPFTVQMLLLTWLLFDVFPTHREILMCPVHQYARCLSR